MATQTGRIHANEVVVPNKRSKYMAKYSAS